MPPLSQTNDYEEEVASTCSTDHIFESNRGRKKIRFHPVVDQRWTLARDDLTSEERYACFYTAEEKKKRSLKHQKNASRMERGVACKASSSFRGLEGWTAQGRHVQDVVISACIESVLEVQQHGRSVEDIATASRNVSMLSIDFAIDMADFDTEQALLAYEIMHQEHAEEESETCVDGDDDQAPVVAIVPTQKQQRRRLRRIKQQRRTSASAAVSSCSSSLMKEAAPNQSPRRMRKSKSANSITSLSNSDVPVRSSRRTTATTTGAGRIRRGRRKSSTEVCTQMDNRDLKKVVTV